MKIKFTLFNGGQEYYEFDTDSLKPGEEIDRFLINTDENGKMYILPMICFKKYTRYPTDILDRVHSEFIKN